MTPEEKHCNQLGPGGYKCSCCGPHPKKRKQHRRLIRTRLKRLFDRLIKKELSE